LEEINLMLRRVFGSSQPSTTPFLLHVMAYELLLGRGKIEGGGKVKRSVMGRKEEMEEIWREISESMEEDDEAKKDEEIMRWIRFNSFKLSDPQQTLDELMEGIVGLEVEGDPFIPWLFKAR